MSDTNPSSREPSSESETGNTPSAPPPHSPPPPASPPPPPAAGSQWTPPAGSTPPPHPSGAQWQPGLAGAGGQVQPSAGSGQLSDADARMWGMFAHLGGLLAIVTGFAGFIPPLVIMLIQGEKSPYVRRHSVESLNFQITLLIAGLVSVFLIVITLGLGLLLVIPVYVAALVFMIIAGLAANRGEDYRYPVNIRLVK